jgi:hypothetical protein
MSETFTEKDKEVLVKSVEKLVRVNQELRDLLNGALKEIDNLKAKYTQLEDTVLKIKTDLQIQKSHSEIAHFNATADEDLYHYMIGEKDQDAVDYPMTKKEIERGLKKYVESSGVKVVDSDDDDECY